jgi:hypothetical protein
MKAKDLKLKVEAQNFTNPLIPRQVLDTVSPPPSAATVPRFNVAVPKA